MQNLRPQMELILYNLDDSEASKTHLRLANLEYSKTEVLNSPT